MFIKLLFVFIVVMASSGLSRNVPRYEDLDEEDQMLFRAAYDTPSYEHEDYQEEEVPGKLDLLKDGMWAIKAKVKEMKTFNKALAANLLATKLQVKELLANHLKTLKKHHHIEIEKKKPVYSYQSPAASYYHYEGHHPAPPAPQYEPHHAPAQPQYGAPHFTPTQTQYGTPQYIPPQTPYGSSEYAPPQQYGAPQPPYDPYYGH